MRELQFSNPRPTDATSSARFARATLGVILLGALALRAWGVQWGLPRVDLNPDELTVLQVTERLSWNQPDPRFYNYSGLTFYLNFVGAQLGRGAGLDIDRQTQLRINRLESVAWGTLTVLVLYAAARALTGRRRTGLLAAGFLAILPLHVWDSHLGTTDVALTFWCIVAFLFAVRCARAPRLRTWLIGGAAVGFATGTKFNGALALASFAAAAFVATRRGHTTSRQALAGLGAAAVAASCAFALTSPFSLVHFGQTLSAFFYESRHVALGHYGFDTTAAGWQYHRGLYQLVAAFPFSLGVALYGAVLAGLVVLWRRMEWERTLLGLAFVAVYLAVTLSWTFTPIRYYLPVMPMLIVPAAWMFDRMLASPRRVHQVAGCAALVGVVLYTAAFTVTTTARFRDDTRLQAARWMDAYLPPAARVVLVEPVLRSYTPRPGRPDLIVRQVPLEAVSWRKELLGENPGRGYLCVSSLAFSRAYRQGDPERIAAWERIRNSPRDYQRIARFSGSFLNERLYTWLDPMYAGYFVSPVIEIYQPSVLASLADGSH